MVPDCLAPRQPIDESAATAARSALDALIRALGANLIAFYVHGSAVLGGYRRDRSDLDILALAETALSDEELEAVAANVAGGPYPAKGLEMSVLTEEEASRPDYRAPRFQVHLATGSGAGAARVVDGRNRDGDLDLVLHLAVCRERGVALLGPPPGKTLATIPVERIRSAMVAEVEWARREGPLEYLVLTSARALLYGETGRIASKIEAGEWALRRYAPPPVVEAALITQGGGAAAIDRRSAEDFAAHVIAVLEGR